MILSNMPINKLKGIGPKKQSLYNKIGIYTAEDLLNYYPVTYQDMRNVSEITSLKAGETSLIKGKVLLVISDSNNAGNRRYKKSVLRLLIGDNTGKLEVVFFNTPYLMNTLHVNDKIYLFGKVELNNDKLQMKQPEIYHHMDFKSGILPIYSTPKGISQKEVRKHIKELLEYDIEDFLPKEILESRNICPLDYKLRNIHFPIDNNHYKVAKYRQIYEDLFVMQLGLEMMKTKNHNGIPMNGSCDKFIDSFDFKLTKAQASATCEILNDMNKDEPMNRLLQGDVGSGKTAVAAIAMYKAVVSGYQAAFMAPTEILAKQHFDSLKKQFEKFNISVGILTGSMKAKEKREALMSIENGQYDVVIGTHALIQQGVLFNKLGLVITDEQHRFGVNQRFKLGDKGEYPHVLVMTATPIPRTLAVILYGDLNMSVIDTLPAGRKPIETKSIESDKRLALYDHLIKEIKDGSQAYVVAPLIEDSESLENIRSVESLYKELSDFYRPFGIRIKTLHGAMKQKEKDDIMKEFNDGHIDMLIATVVIEVGINVPNATIMVIENSERFGLAQLHQLRGRVGRGKKQSYCYLINNSKGDVAKKRTQIMCQSTDGFYISEKDLNLRGPGEVFGTRQHGIPDINLINAVKHMDILNRAKKDAEKYADLIDNKLMKKVEKLYGENLSIQL